MKPNSEQTIWHGKPSLVPFVLGRAIPPMAGTALYLSSPILGILARGASAQTWEIVLLWVGLTAMVGPLAFYFLDWCFTRYSLTDRHLLIQRSFGRQSIPRSRILRTVAQRETLDGFYPPHFGSLLVTILESERSVLPIARNTLLIPGIPYAQRIESIFQTGGDGPALAIGDWCFGNTKTNLVRLECRSR